MGSGSPKVVIRSSPRPCGPDSDAVSEGDDWFRDEGDVLFDEVRDDAQ